MSKFSRVMGLLSLMGGAVLTAFLIVSLLVINYGPSGHYKMANVLVTPTTLFNLRYKEVDPMSGSSTAYTFDQVQFSFPDAKERRWQRLTVTPESYNDFYNLVLGEQSFTPEEELVTRFSQQNFSSLSVQVKPQHNLGRTWSSRVFQEIHFLEGSDFFRVELRVDDPEGSWAYFKKKGIYEETLRIFAAKDSSLGG